MEAILKQEWSVDQALAEIGVTREQIAEVVRAGESARSTRTKNDPGVMRGVLVWGRMVRALREQMIPHGWGRSETGYLETAIRADRRVAISCATGDEHTGIEDANPFTKYRKGPRTVDAVAQNHNQINFLAQLDPPGFKVRKKVEPTPDTLTWLLLTHRTSTEIRCELSLPQMIGPDGRVTGWAQRLILPPVSIDGDESSFSIDDDATEHEEIVVEVERRR